MLDSLFIFDKLLYNFNFNYMSYKEQITLLIIDILKEIGKETNNKKLINAKPDTRLYGSGDLDSLLLVRLISEVENRIEEDFDKEIIIATERAMSQRLSPFLSVSSFSEYVTKLVENNNK